MLQGQSDSTYAHALRRRLRSDFSPLPFLELTKYGLPPGRIVAYLNPIFEQELFKSDLLYFGRLRYRRHVVPGEPVVCSLEARCHPGIVAAMLDSFHFG